MSLIVCSASVRVKIYVNVSNHPPICCRYYTYRMWQNARQMGKVALVQRQDALRLDRPAQAVKRRCVQVARLIVHARHDGIRGVHNAANDEATRGTTSNMQRHALFHTQVFYQPSLCEEIRGELYRAAETCAYHGWSYASV